MKNRSISALVFVAMVVLAIPAVVHSVLSGAYAVDPGGSHRTFWIGPVSTTIPFAILGLLFLVHVLLLKSESAFSAYIGAVVAWLSMMGFTVFLVNQAPGPQISSTMAIAVMLTPVFYLPLLLLSYLVGALVGVVVEWRKRNGDVKQV